MVTQEQSDYYDILEVWRRVRNIAFAGVDFDVYWSMICTGFQDRIVLRKRWFGIGDDDRVF